MKRRMAQVPRRIWLLSATFLLLIVGTIALQLATPAESGASLPRGTTLSASPTGSLALSQWLNAEGFVVSPVREFPFNGSGLDVLFVIAPETVRYSTDDADDIKRYVENGGTLIFATDGNDDATPLRTALELDIANHGDMLTASPTNATLSRPPVRTITLDGGGTVDPVTPGDARFLERARTTRGVAVATMVRGKGRVHVVTSPYPLSNKGLPDADNLALVQNLLAGQPKGAAVGFDEYHHGYGVGRSVADLALRSPWGWAMLYLAALLFAVFALNGRRFGRALPAPAALARPTAEYARALGRRWQEGKQRAFAQAHLAERLKRDLAATLALSPTGDDDGAFLTALNAARPDLAVECDAVLAALRDPAARDSDLVAVAQRADALRHYAAESRSALR